MRAYEANIDDLVPVVDGHNQSILVASDVEDHPVVPKDARRPIARLYVCGLGPVRGLGLSMPGFECGLRVRPPRPASSSRTPLMLS